MKRTLGVTLLCACWVLVALSYGNGADWCLKYATEMPAMQIGMAQGGPRTDTAAYYFREGYSRADASNKMTRLYEVATGRYFALYNKFKLYSVIEPSDTDTAKDVFSDWTESRSPHMETVVTPTDSQQVVNGYHCRLYYAVSSIANGMMHDSSEIWATEEIPIEPDLYLRTIYAFSLGSDMASADEIEQMQSGFTKIKGVMVRSVSHIRMNMEMLRMMEQQSTSELIEAKPVDLPKDFFEVPKDYELYQEGAPQE